MATARTLEPSPGKRTLAAPAQVGVVQRRAGEAATQDVHAAASRGIASPATTLPYLHEIQASFGAQHDVASIQAHVGAGATAAASAMGASAYATGNHTVFAGFPDLRTAAHEAAHVVQQRGGVHLRGGVGQTGDPYEHQADAVADRVVQGMSAADLFGPAGRATPERGSDAPIQRTCGACGGTKQAAAECPTCKASAASPARPAVQRQPAPDGGVPDAGTRDAGTRDAGTADAGRASGSAAQGSGTANAASAANAIDATAEALIALAQAQTPAIDQRAIQLVTRMLATYYPADASKFSTIRWAENDPGVTAVCAPSGGANMTCELKVGRYFVENTTRRHISRRVLQIGHELQHVEQHRQGMGGPGPRHEREFLAFHWEATAPEASGTGRMQHANRSGLIDAAIGNYQCLTPEKKASYDAKYQQLLTLRRTEQSASGNAATPVPTTCSG